MFRRLFSFCALATFALAATFASPAANAQATPRIGIVLLHGKAPGNAAAPHYSAFKAALEREGWLVVIPDMPWSRGRFLDGNWDKAMAEVGSHVKALRDQGATRIVVAGHSLGVPGALSYAARGGDTNALVLLAPGHVPKMFYEVSSNTTVRESVDEARALVTAGKGDERQRFRDINQGAVQPVVATAKDFLSYYDPASDAEMGNTAPRVPGGIPVFTAIGANDSLFKRVREYYVDKLPTNPKHLFLEVSGGHLDTPRIAADDAVKWIKTAVAP